MNFHIAGVPKCPGCCIELASVAITFNEGWAWCPVCTNQKLYAQTHLQYVMNHDLMQRCAIMSHGLRFYVPSPLHGQIPNAIDCFEKLLNEPETRQAAIEHWPGFTLQQLPQAARDRGEQPSPVFQRDVRIPSGWQIAGITDTGQMVLTEIVTEEETPADTIASMP